MFITKLDRFDRAVLQHVLDKEGVEYLSYHPQLFVSKCEYIGVGCYVF